MNLGNYNVIKKEVLNTSHAWVWVSLIDENGTIMVIPMTRELSNKLLIGDEFLYTLDLTPIP